MSLPPTAIVGAGVIAAQHGIVIDQLPDRLELVAVVDRDAAKAEALVGKHGGAVFATLEEAFAAGPIELVVVCTPTGEHGPVAIEAIERGAHVIIEKPAEITVERADEILAAQQRGDRIVSVISQHRFDPSTEIVLDRIRAGELGRLTSGVAAIDWWRGQSYYDSGDWRGTWALDGGGALMNQGVHTVDLLVAALGRPVEVFGYTATNAHERIEVEDVAVGVVRFESGALGVLHASTAVYPGLVTRLQVHGDRGSAVIENDRLTYLHATAADADATEIAMGAQNGDANQASRYHGEDGRPQVAGTSVPGAMGDAHLFQYRDVLAAIDGEREVRVGIAENRRAIAIITGLYESTRTGRPVALEV